MTFLKEQNEQQEALKSPTKKRHWGRYILLIFLIILAVMVIVVYRFAQKPAEGIVKPVGQNSKAIEVGSAVPATFTGRYVSFMYDNSYVLKSNELASDSADVILEHAYLSESGAMSKKISLTIRSLPSHNLEDDPDYLMRERNPKRYQKENFSQGNISGVAFIPADDSQFEKTFFVLHNDLVATLSVTMPSAPDEKFNKDADAIVKSLTWLK